MNQVTAFTEEEVRRIEAAVAEAEKKTSGEIVPMIVSASHDYWWVNGLFSVLGWALASLALWVWDTYFGWPLEALDLLIWQVFGISAGFLLARIDLLKRAVLPNDWAAAQVHRQCLANFVAAGLHETRDRTGVLIYLSQLEHRVELLADRGIHEKTPKGYWQGQVDHLIAGIKQDKAVDHLVQVIEAIGTKLAENFPPREDDTNELSNRLHREHAKLEKPDDPKN